MSVFADSSALVKLYADEEGSSAVAALSPLVVSSLARVEIPAALWRKQRLGEVKTETASTLVVAFEADYFGTKTAPPRFTRVPPGPSILDAGARLVGTHGLRAYDAVQLAGALAAHNAEPACDTFACFDDPLRAAAAAEGFALAPS